MLTRGAVHDPGIGFITLTRVKVSPDLQMARVYYTSMGDEKARRETARALERATPFFRRQVGAPSAAAARARARVPVRRIDRPPGPHRADPARPARRGGAAQRGRRRISDAGDGTASSDTTPADAATDVSQTPNADDRD